MHNRTCSRTHRFTYALLVVVMLWRFNDRADVKLLLLHLPLRRTIQCTRIFPRTTLTTPAFHLYQL